jgi:hypothetical protein
LVPFAREYRTFGHFRLSSGTKSGTKTPHLNGVDDGKTTTQFSPATKEWGVQSAGVSPGRATRQNREEGSLHSVWQVSEFEAAKLAWPEVQKFEAMIEQARTGTYFPAVEMETPGRLRPLVPTFKIRGVRTAASETTFTNLIEEWARKKRIDNPQTRRRAESQFNALAAFLGHDN